MKFFCISGKRLSGAEDLLKKACEKNSIEYVEIETGLKNLNFLNYKKPSKGDCLYRVATDNINAKKIEFSFAGKEIATFYDRPDVIFRPYAGLKLEKYGIPAPKTIPILTNYRPILKNYVEYLGGFPIIIKSMGGKGGVGVMRVDSYGSLFSIADFLHHNGGNYIIREYINTKESIRAIVIGDEVVASVKYKASNKEDFRSNRKSGLDYVEKYECSPEMAKIAVDSVKCMELEFGGVDIIVDAENKCYIPEVNFPCNFIETQIITQVDISDLMIKYLIEKSKKINKN